jgi:hypothetical protein
MRPVPAILVFVAVLIAFDYAVNDGDLVRDLVRWLVRFGRSTAVAIHGFVMTVFGK